MRGARIVKTKNLHQEKELELEYSPLVIVVSCLAHRTDILAFLMPSTIVDQWHVYFNDELRRITFVNHNPMRTSSAKFHVVLWDNRKRAVFDMLGYRAARGHPKGAQSIYYDNLRFSPSLDNLGVRAAAYPGRKASLQTGHSWPVNSKRNIYEYRFRIQEII